MKKSILTIAAVAASLFMVSCAKENLASQDNVTSSDQEINQNFVFNLEVSMGNEAKGGKAAWENGDQLLGFFRDDLTLGHQLRLTFDGSKWNGSFDDNDFASSFKADDSGDLWLISTEGNIEFKTDVNKLTLNNYTGGKVLKSETTYSVSQGPGYLVFSSSITMTNYSDWAFVLTGVTDENPSHWTLKTNGILGKTEKGASLGSELKNYKNVSFTGSDFATDNNTDPVPAYTDGDYKVCFAGQLSIADGDVVVIAKNSDTGKEYFRIIQQKSIKNLSSKFIKLDIASFTEKDDVHSWVNDTQGNYYRTYKANDTLTIMCDNYRYIPAGMKISTNPAETSVHVWYPEIVESSSSAVATTDTTDVFKYGYMYDFYALFGEEYSTAAAAAKYDGAKGICPDGWHVPTRDQLNAITGVSTKCTRYGETKNETNSYATEYESDWGGGRISSMNAKGYNILPSGYINNTGYSKLPLDATKCTIEKFYGRPSMTYWWTSTSSTDTQVMAWMTTFTSSFKDGKLTIGGMNIKNAKHPEYNFAAPLRCVKDIVK